MSSISLRTAGACRVGTQCETVCGAPISLETRNSFYEFQSDQLTSAPRGPTKWPVWGERLRTSAGPFVASVAAFFACARHIELSAAFVKRVDEAVPTEAAAEANGNNETWMET